MNSLFRLSCSVLLSHSLTKPPLSISNLGSRFTAVKLDLRFTVRCYSSAKKKKKTRVMCENNIKNEFFVVRKGDLIGVYKTLTDCQSQVGSSICDPPVSVYKGNSMPKNTEKYILSCGLKNALYSIRAADLKDDLFGPLIPCLFQLPSSVQTEIDLPLKRSFDAMNAETINLCILEFDGASKGNPGQAGAGAVLRSHDGTVICKLRQGLGTATNNFAEYRAMILGLRYALDKGFKSIRVLGDSMLVCMQIQGLWKVKDKNMLKLHKEATILKEKFLSFEINHILRESNPDADAQANLGVTLADGEIQEEFT